ncbi:MAG: LPS-assembly protein LptD [Verrucomicrobiaceae bacterium]|nr:MAG: LPS-assembly protein LptD [Verrucomicrobiaceae bacterium]
MLRPAAWLVAPLLFLPAGMATAQDASDPGVLPAVDTITPVPAPEMPFGNPAGLELTMPKELKINNQGGRIEGDIETGVRLGGPVKIEGDNGLEMFSDTAVLDLKAKTVTLTGNVTVYQGNLMQRGEQAIYHYERKFLDNRGLRASLDPVLLEAGKFTAEQRGNKQVLVGYDAGITTHDVEDPGYWLRAKKTTIYPGDKIVFNDLKLYAGDTPVFWFPYLAQPLDAELGYHFTPGARSNWGPFLLNTYGIMLGGETDPDTGEKENAWLLSRWHFDIRTSRGIGTGLDLVDTRLERSEEITGLSLYYLNDMDPGDSRNGVPRGFVNEDRYKAELKQRIRPDFPGGGDWWVDANLTWLSDRHYLEDLEMDRYRTDPAPDNTVGIYRRDDASMLSLFARFQLNDFYRADTRYPEIFYDRARAPFFGLPVLHEGSTSLGYIGEEAADPTRGAIIDPLRGMTLSDPGAQRLLDQLGGYERSLAEQMLALSADDPRREAIATQLLDSGYGRFHTYQEWSLPMLLGGFLSVTPEAGVGYTRYGAVDGPEGGSEDTHLHVGVESSVKFSRDLGDFQNHDWGLDGLRHVFQPYGTWSVVSSDDFAPGDPGVDRLTPTTRPRPIDPLRFTALDQMQSWNVLRLGARNRLLTRRDGGSFEWFYLDTYFDTFIEDPEGERDFSNLYNDARWQPLPWMGVHLETQFPIADSGSGFSEFASRVNFQPNERFDISLGYRWLNGHPVLVDSSRVDLRTYIRLSENWGFGTRHELELDDSTLEEQIYSFHRDLGNWVAGMGISSRDNRFEQEYGVVFSLTLKEFPSVSLPFELDAQ